MGMQMTRKQKYRRVLLALAALFLILVNNPFAVKSVSLQLSFGAVVGLLWLSPKL